MCSGLTRSQKTSDQGRLFFMALTRNGCFPYWIGTGWNPKPHHKLGPEPTMGELEDKYLLLLVEAHNDEVFPEAADLSRFVARLLTSSCFIGFVAGHIINCLLWYDQN